MSMPSPDCSRTTNWSSYTAALRMRGSLLVWLDKEMAWLAPHNGKPGRRPIFSNAARAKRGIDADWTAESLARHTQAVLQGGFILAKATGNADLARESVDHLIRYVRGLFDLDAGSTTRLPNKEKTNDQPGRNTDLV